MNRKNLLKTVLVMVITMVLLGISTNVFAADDDTYLDITGPLTGTDTGTDNETNTGTNTGTDNGTTTIPDTNGVTDTNTSTNNNQTNNYDTNLPETGVAENTMLVVAIVTLAGIAIFAHKKVNEYKNI